MLFEPFIPRKKTAEEESIAQFATRRLGAGVIPTLLTPMTSGIFAAPPDKLSLRAAFPKLYDWEQEYGSLFRALKGAPRSAPPVLTSLKKSAGSLCTHLEQTIGPRLKLATPAQSLFHDGTHWHAL